MADLDYDLNNGSNLIVLDERERILVVREVSREHKLMLPGGTIDRGESPRHAAQSETEEESAIITDEADFKLIGLFVQRPKGVVFLYETRRFSGEPKPKGDTSEAKFMTFDEIMANPHDFRIGYLRMILRWKRCKLGIDRIPYEGRLSDVVEFPRRLNEDDFVNLVLSV